VAHLKRVAIVIAVLLILGTVLHYKKETALRTDVKAAQSQAYKDTVTDNYANFVLISSSYLDYLFGVIDENKQDVKTFAHAARIYIQNNNSLKLGPIIRSEYDKTYGQKSGDLIKMINLNLAQYQDDLYGVLQRTDINQSDENALIQSNRALSADLRQSSPNLYDIEKVYKLTEKTYDQKTIYSFLENLNQEIMTMDSKVIALDK